MQARKLCFSKIFASVLFLLFSFFLFETKSHAAGLDNGFLSAGENWASFQGTFINTSKGNGLQGVLTVTGTFADGTTGTRTVGTVTYSTFSGSSWNSPSITGLNKNTQYTVTYSEYYNGIQVGSSQTKNFKTPYVTNGSSIVLNWSNVGLTGSYSWQIMGPNNTIIWSGTSLTYTDSKPLNLNSNNNYVVVLVYNGGNYFTYYLTGYAGTTPAAVSGLKATAQGNAVQLTWNSVSNAQSYTIKRGTTVLATVSGTSYVDTGLSYNTNYTYTVSATNPVGTGTASSVSVTTEVAKQPVAPTISLSTTSLTKNNIYAYISYSLDSTVKQYKLEGDTAWSNYTGAILLKGNTTVYAQSSNSAGYTSNIASYVVNNIDTTPPTSPSISLNGKQLTITPGTDASGINNTQYQLNSGSWVTYTSAVTLADGTYVINAKSVDNAGNESAISTFNAVISDVQIATDLVVKAENSQKQADVDTARSAVNALPDSQAKTDLINRLDAVQQAIDAYNALQAQIADATAKVVTAEGSQKQADVDTARTAVNALPSSQTKTDLNNRLDVVQQAINGYVLQAQIADATAKVVTAEGTQKQADVDSARNAVNALPSGQTKTDLSNRLDAVQQAIDAYNALQAQIADATAKVVTAEGSQKQADVDTARNAVNALQNSQIKTDLSNRLDVVQAAIDAKAKAQSIQSELNTMQGNLENGNFTVSDLDNYKDRLSELVDEVLALSNGSTQDALLQQISDLSDLIDLIESVFAASTGDLINVDLNQLNNLPNSPLKDQLQEKVNEAQQLADAIDAATALVTKAEQNKIQQDVDVARSAVEALPDSQAKTDLENRLDVVQKQIDDALQAQIADATAKVVTAEGTQKQVDVDTARTAVNALPAGQTKTDLSNRLDVVQAAIDAYNALQAQIADATAKVVTAEGSQKQADVDTARNAVNALPSGQTKTELSKRLDAVQQAIDAYNALQAQIADATAKVVTAEGSQKQADVDTARNAVNALPNGQTKTDLSNRLDVVQAAIDAYNALQAKIADATAKVVTAENSQKQADVDTARTAVNALPSGQTKTDLSNRLDAVQQAIDAYNALQAQIADATAKVVAAENSKTQADIDVARNVVNALPDGQTKTDLLNRLDAIQVNPPVVYTNINDIEDANVRDLFVSVDFYVTQAETNFVRDNILLARDAVVGISADIANDPRYAVIYQNLKNRENYLITLYNQMLADTQLQTAINNANTAVANYEKYKTAYYKSRAQSAVDALPEGVVKDDLQARINAVV